MGTALHAARMSCVFGMLGLVTVFAAGTAQAVPSGEDVEWPFASVCRSTDVEWP
jgi:hypothetical protein